MKYKVWLLMWIGVFWGYSSWMEELTTENTQSDKKAMENKSQSRGKKKSLIKQELIYSVSLIEAVLQKNSDKVVINWMDIEDNTARYKIYRFTKPIESIEILQSASYRGVVNSGLQHFEDTLEEPGRYYYAVITEVYGESKPAFMYEQSYTTTPVIFDVKSNKYRVSGINSVYNRFFNSVFIKWDDPLLDDSMNDSFSLLVYRGDRPIDSKEQLSRALFLQEVEKGEEKFQDMNVKFGKVYYYAIFVKREKAKGPELVFIPQQNYTTDGNRAEKKGTLAVFEDDQPKKRYSMDFGEIENDLAGRNSFFNANQPLLDDSVNYRTKDLVITYNKKEQYIALRWKLNSAIGKPFYQNIYRSLKPIENVEQLENRDILLESVATRNGEKGEKFEYRDYNVEFNTDYYYAVILDVGKGLTGQRLYLLDNYIKYPVKIFDKDALSSSKFKMSGDNPEEIDKANELKQVLKDIIRKQFLKEEFRLAIEKLQEYEGQTIDFENKKTVLTFIGRSYLSLGEHKKALRYFHELKELDLDAGEFWIEKTVDAHVF